LSKNGQQATKIHYLIKELLTSDKKIILKHTTLQNISTGVIEAFAISKLHLTIPQNTTSRKKVRNAVNLLMCLAG